MKWTCYINILMCVVFVAIFAVINHQTRAINELQQDIHRLHIVSLIDSLAWRYVADKASIAEAGFYVMNESAPSGHTTFKRALDSICYTFKAQDSIYFDALEKLTAALNADSAQ